MVRSSRRMGRSRQRTRQRTRQRSRGRSRTRQRTRQRSRGRSRTRRRRRTRGRRSMKGKMEPGTIVEPKSGRLAGRGLRYKIIKYIDQEKGMPDVLLQKCNINGEKISKYDRPVEGHIVNYKEIDLSGSSGGSSGSGARTPTRTPTSTPTRTPTSTPTRTPTRTPTPRVSSSRATSAGRARQAQENPIDLAEGICRELPGQSEGILNVRGKELEKYLALARSEKDASIELTKSVLADLEKQKRAGPLISPGADKAAKEADREGATTIINYCIEFLDILVDKGKLTRTQAKTLYQIIPSTTHWSQLTEDQSDFLLAVMNNLWSGTTPPRSLRRKKSLNPAFTTATGARVEELEYDIKTGKFGEISVDKQGPTPTKGQKGFKGKEEPTFLSSGGASGRPPTPHPHRRSGQEPEPDLSSSMGSLNLSEAVKIKRIYFDDMDARSYQMKDGHYFVQMKYSNEIYGPIPKEQYDTMKGVRVRTRRK